MESNKTDEQKLKKRFIALTELWYCIVNLDHHKDRDCHFFIKEVYSYGDNPTYEFAHYGYLVKEIEKSFKTYNKCLKFAVTFLEKVIKNELSRYLDEKETKEYEISETDIKKAKEFNNKFISILK